MFESNDMSRCAELIATTGDLERCQLMTDLAYERMERKQVELLDILHRTNNDWNQTMFIMLLRYMGGQHNKSAAEVLAHRIGYNTIVRESGSLINIEALLFGTSGLLELLNEDSYTSRLGEEFRHLAAKYSIEPMDATMWKLKGMYANSHPILRLAQLAACFHRHSITMNSLLECRKRRDISKLFNATISDYWVDVVHRFTAGSFISNRIGSFTSDILGINFVVQMIFAYGHYTHSEVLTQRALELLEDIPSENNRYTTIWNYCTQISKSALESQAIIQLSRQYCECSRCEECPLAKMLKYKAAAKQE
ncbi:MAG: DUF2851 family protein [Alistipes sp.]|jgi:hypothetical protein|nr:DUF2851 family protein [Alistipes sp.]